MMSGNPYDGSAAQLVPQNIEKFPLYHLEPGSRLLCIGSRDGAAFNHDVDFHERGSFQRPLNSELICAANERAGTQGLALAWSTVSAFSESIHIAEESGLPLHVACHNGHSIEGGLTAEFFLEKCTAVAALYSEDAGPDLVRICAEARHVELMWGLNEEPKFCPDLAWENIKAVHVVPRYNSQADQDYYDIVRNKIPTEVPVYDQRHQHSVCECGAVLIWRQGGRSRREALSEDYSHCTVCHKKQAFTRFA